MKHASWIYWTGCFFLTLSSVSWGQGQYSDRNFTSGLGPRDRQFGQGLGGGFGGAGRFGGGMGMGAFGGGGYGASNSGARQSAEKISEIGAKAQQNMSQAAEKSSEGMKSLAQGFSQNLQQLNPPEEKSEILKGLTEELAKRAEATAKAPPVGEDIVASLLDGIKKSADTKSEILKLKAMALEPSGPVAPQRSDSRVTVADQLSQFAGGQKNRSESALVRADRLTNPQAEIPDDGHNHGNAFHGHQHGSASSRGVTQASQGVGPGGSAARGALLRAAQSK